MQWEWVSLLPGMPQKAEKHAGPPLPPPPFFSSSASISGVEVGQGFLGAWAMSSPQ